MRPVICPLTVRVPRSGPQLLERVEGRVAGTELDKCSLGWDDLWDVVQYVTDLATSLDAFLRVYPAGGVHFRETGLLVRCVDREGGEGSLVDFGLKFARWMIQEL